MRWFERKFESDQSAQEAYGAYREHIAAIAPRLAPDLLALSALSLEDGLIERLTINEPAGTVTLRLLIGDNQQGYSHARLKYFDATLASPTADLRWLVEYERTELIYDELDLVDTSYSHRLLFWPAGEIHITFTAFRLELKPTIGRHRSTGPELRWKLPRDSDSS